MLRESIARTIAISIVYSIIETHFILLNQGGNVISPYHVLVLLVGAIAAFDRNLMVWVANILTYSVLEDAFYWVFRHQLPYSWGSEYIVICHVPLYYIPYLALALSLYKRGMKNGGEHN
jgi:hypothetical protein